MKFTLNKLLPIALCLLFLAGCGDKAQVKEFDPAATAQALNDSGAFSESLEQMDTDIFCMLYGLEESDLTDGVVYASTGSTAEEFAVWTLKDADSATRALELLNTRLIDQKEANKDYRPMDMPKLESAIVEQRGNSVVLVVANDAKAAQTALG